jgi:hypothetical protein
MPVATGAPVPGGPSPLPAAAGTAIEVDRLVNGNGLASLADRQFNVGYQLAGQKLTLRMDGTQMAVIDHDGTLLRTMPCPVPPAERGRLPASTAQPWPCFANTTACKPQSVRRPEPLGTTAAAWSSPPGGENRSIPTR